MAYQFDPSAYGQIYENAQNRNFQQQQQGRQAVAQSISAIPQAFVDIQNQKKQQDMQQLAMLLQAKQNGLDYTPAGQTTDQSSNTGNGMAPSSPGASPVGPYSNPQPSTAPTSTTSGSYSTPPSPSPLMQSQSPIVQAHKQVLLKNSLGTFSQDPQPDYYQTPQGQVGIGNTPQGAVKIPMKEGISALGSQYKENNKPQKDSQVLNFSQAKLIVPTLDQAAFNAAYPNGIPREELGMMSKPNYLSTMNTVTYDTATPDDQRSARDLAMGKTRTSDFGQKDRGRIVALASEYAAKNGIDFHSYGGDVNAGMAKNLAYGKMGQNVVSFNTALGHIGDAEKAYQAVGNTDSRFLNTPINALKKQGNDPNIIALDLNLNAVAGELANAFKTGGATDTEIGHFASTLNDTLTPAQAHAALSKAGELLNSRINAVQNQQSSVMGSNGGQRQLLSPLGSKVMNQLGGNSHPQDSQAVQWAKQNPNDPRSKKILQLNGAQ